MTDIACPAHLADVHQAFDPRLQLHKRAVVRDTHDLALDTGPHRVLLGDILPGIGVQLLEPKGDPLPVPVDVEHLDLDLLTQLHHLRGVRDTAPAHVRDV